MTANPQALTEERVVDEIMEERTHWLAGFWAASLLFNGRYTDYAAERDKFLTATQGIIR